MLFTIFKNSTLFILCLITYHMVIYSSENGQGKIKVTHSDGKSFVHHYSLAKLNLNQIKKQMNDLENDLLSKTIKLELLDENNNTIKSVDVYDNKQLINFLGLLNSSIIQ